MACAGCARGRCYVGADNALDGPSDGAGALLSVAVAAADNGTCGREGRGGFAYRARLLRLLGPKVSLLRGSACDIFRKTHTTGSGEAKASWADSRKPHRPKLERRTIWMASDVDAAVIGIIDRFTSLMQ